MGQTETLREDGTRIRTVGKARLWVLYQIPTSVDRRPNNTDMGRRPSGQPIPVSRVLDRGMRPAKDIRSVRKGNRDVRTQGVQEPLTSPLSPLVESFNPRPTSEKQQNQRQRTNNDLDRSPAMTGLGETETSWDSIKNKIATIGTAKPIEIGKPVAMADVAEPRGLAGAGAGGPVVTGMSIVTGTRFLAVAEVYAPIAETEGDQRSDIRKIGEITEVITEMTSP